MTKKEKQGQQSFDLESDINQKREWAQRQLHGGGGPDPAGDSYTQPSARLFEHFAIVGLPPALNAKAVTADIQTYNTARQAGGAGMESITPDRPTGSGNRQYGLKGPALPAEVLYSFPGLLPADLAANLAAFCHPHGVRPELLERTPSMSALNEVIYSQPHQTQDDHSFVFLMRVADGSCAAPRSLYGVCCYMQELVHRPPALARETFPDCTAPLSRYMVAAPRCYCLLTHYPFFALHFRVLQTILGLERLDRMTALSEELALGLSPSPASSRMSTVSADSPAPYASYSQTEVSSSSSDGSVRAEIGKRGGIPLDGTEDSEVDAAGGAHGSSGSQQAEAALSRLRIEGLPRGEVHASSPEPSSSDNSSDFATPSVPLLATPFFTPGTGAGRSSAAGRRAARHHAAAAPSAVLGAPASSEQAMPDATPGTNRSAARRAVGERVEHVKRVLEDNLAEIDARLTPSPGKQPVGDGQPAAASTAAAAEEEAVAFSRALGSEAPEADTDYAPAGHSSAPSVANFAAALVASKAAAGAAAGGPCPPPVNPAADQAGLNELLMSNNGGPAASLQSAQYQLQRAVEVQVTTTFAEFSPADAGFALVPRSDTLGRDDIVTPAPLEPQQRQEQEQEQEAAPDHSSPPSSNGRRRHPGSARVVRVTAANVDLTRPLAASDLLSVYREAMVPQPGQVFEFQPDPGLQTIAFRRPDMAEAMRELGLRPSASALPDIDAAQNLGGWAVAALCRSMSLDNILTYLTSALLERQMVVFCPNIGLLSGVVLSLVPMLLPFSWQCLMLPVLPALPSRLDLLEAPVPFVLGVVYKTAEVAARCGALVRVNVYKDRIKNAAGALPPLPQQATLAEALAGTYSELRRAGQTRAAATRPAHLVTDAQQVLGVCFLTTLQKYLGGLVAELKGYTITDVSGANPDQRVSVLLRESFVDSFPPRDRPFMRQFTETQMFSVYCDSVL